MAYQTKGGSESLLVAAIDFGTTYSGWAFSFKHEFDTDPLKVSAKQWTGGQLVSLKGPTCVLIKNDGETVDCFGFEAETKYAEKAGDGEHKQWYFFKRFKMMLFKGTGVKKNVLLEDASGRKLPALKVFSLCIQFLKKDLLDMSNSRLANGGISTDDIHWVLTVPAIWNDAAKQFMREAAESAGIKSHNLTIALEPEAASLYCRHLPVEKCLGEEKFSLAKFKAGSKYIVIDAGGGTVDITVHEITSNGDVRELHQASGGAWGGTKVDEAFEKFLGELVGNYTMKQFKERNMEDYIELFRDFEIKKRTIFPTKEGKITCKIPISIVELYKDQTGKDLKDSIGDSKYGNRITVAGDKLRIEAQLMQKVFAEPVQSVANHVQDLLRLQAVRGCTALLLVGGFSESPMLQDKIRKSFPRMKVIVPEDAGLAVLKGAVIFGHSPRAIAERVCKYTYGTDYTHVKGSLCDHPPCETYIDGNGNVRCRGIFSIHVTMGQTVKLGEELEEQIYNPITNKQNSISFKLFASSLNTPKLVTEKGCHEIGQCCIPIPDTTGGTDREVGVTFMFGGTEIEVKFTDKTTGKITRKRVDFLG